MAGMDVYKSNEVDQTKHEISCVHTVCIKIPVKSYKMYKPLLSIFICIFHTVPTVSDRVVGFVLMCEKLLTFFSCARSIYDSEGEGGLVKL